MLSRNEVECLRLMSLATDPTMPRSYDAGDEDPLDSPSTVPFEEDEDEPEGDENDALIRRVCNRDDEDE